MSATFANLQELIDTVPSLVDYFYHDTLAPHARDSKTKILKGLKRRNQVPVKRG